MRNKYITIIILIILFSFLILSSCMNETIKPEINTEKTLEESEVKEKPETKEVTLIQEIKEEDLGEEFIIKGSVIFIDKSSEGLFIELEDKTATMGMFIEDRILKTIPAEKIDNIQQEKTIQVKGTLKKNKEKLILLVNDISSFKIIDQKESTVDESEITTTKIPDEFQLDVDIVYSGHQERTSLCYLGAFSMLVKYLEPEIEFCDAVAASGIGTNAGFVDMGNSPSLGNGIGEASIILSANNLNTSFVLGLKNGGNDSAAYYPSQLKFGNQAKEVQNFDNSKDAYSYLKFTISSGSPVIVYIDCYYLYDDFTLASDFWKNNMVKDHYDHYMVVTGYDNDNIYLNDATDPTEAGKDIPVKIENFTKAWEKGAEVGQRLGPFWVISLTDEISPRPFNEIIRWNTDISKDAVSEIKKFAEDPNSSEKTCFLINELGKARIEFSKYLKENNMVEPASLYQESGEIYSEMALDKSVTTEKLNLIIDKESDAREIMIE